MIYGYALIAAVLLLATLLYLYNLHNERKHRRQRLQAIQQRLAEIESGDQPSTGRRAVSAVQEVEDRRTHG